MIITCAPKERCLFAYLCMDREGEVNNIAKQQQQQRGRYPAILSSFYG